MILVVPQIPNIRSSSLTDLSGFILHLAEWYAENALAVSQAQNHFEVIEIWLMGEDQVGPVLFYNRSNVSRANARPASDPGITRCQHL